ncbi:MAG: xylulokinase [Sphaerochaetaceae bacterium]
MITAGIDCGTQSTKVICYDSDIKRIVCMTNEAHSIIEKNDGTREQLASWYVDAVVKCFQQIPKEIRTQIKGIGVSGQQHGFVALDEEGNTLVPVKLWCDTSTTLQCKELTEKLGGKDEVFSLIGNYILPGYTVSKVLYLKENNPEKYQKLAHILLPHDYLNYYLTGTYVTERGDASGTAYYDVRHKKWSKEVLAALDEERDLETLLPRILEPTEIAGYVRPAIIEQLGLSGKVVVSSGGGDNMMGAIGCGCVHEGDLVMSMGTSGTLFGFSNVPICDEQGRLAGFMASSGGYLPLLCTMNCTVAMEQIRKLFNVDVRKFDEIASKAAPGASGMLILPYFNGERTPNYPHGEAVLGGVNTLNLSMENIARASLESAVYSMRRGLDAFVEKGFSPKKLLLIGGGANSRVWTQIVSDIFGLPVSIPAIHESAAFGGVLQILSILEDKPLPEIAEKHCRLEDKEYKPQTDKKSFYQATYEKYKAYETGMKNLFS